MIRLVVEWTVAASRVGDHVLFVFVTSPDF